jgi:hypothetical protein
VAIRPNHCAGEEGVKVKFGVVQHPLRFGVRRLQDLKTSIEKESRNTICSYAASKAVGCLNDLEGDTILMEVPCTSQACESTTDNHDIWI